MDASTINLLLQIPLAGVVVVVVVLFLRYLEKMIQQMITFMNDQASINREFLKEQREQSNAAIGRLAEEQKETRSEFSKLAGVIEHLVTYLPPARKNNRNT